MSYDVDVAHHAGFLMLEDVAVEHPFPRFAADDTDLDTLFRKQQHGIGAKFRQMAQIRVQYLEGVAVDMDRMGVSRQVFEFKYVAPAGFQHRQRRSKIAVIHRGPGLLVDGPKSPICETERTNLNARSRANGSDAGAGGRRREFKWDALRLAHIEFLIRRRLQGRCYELAAPL